MMNLRQWMMVTVATLSMGLPWETSAADPPRVAVAWAAGPMEVRVVLDPAIDPSSAAGVVGTRIEFTDPAAAGRPGPQGARGSLRVAAARVEDDGRTLVLTTDPHPRETTYSLTLPKLRAAGTSGDGAPVPVRYDLSGVAVRWRQGPRPDDPGADEADLPATWNGWWPEFATDPSRALTRLSPAHQRFWAGTGELGRLTLRAFVLIPPGTTALTFEGSTPFRVALGNQDVRSFAPAGGKVHRAAARAEAGPEPVELSVILSTGGPTAADAGPLRLQVEAITDPTAPGRPLPRSALVPPWVPPTPVAAAPGEVPPAVLSGGDPKRGELVFRSETAKCANCHVVRGNGQGPAVGPDLGHLAGADRAWVYQSIAEPSAAIHPDFTAYTVAMKDGRVAMGVVRAEGADRLRVADIDAKFSEFPTAEVDELRPSASSIMPVGLLGPIGEEGVRDLLAYLTARP